MAESRGDGAAAGAVAVGRASQADPARWGGASRVTGRRLVMPAKREVTLEEFELTRPLPGEVRVRTLCSLMSTGTELTVFNQRFAPGTHWEMYAQLPHRPGYTVIAEVEAVGPEVDWPPVGQRVAIRRSHASHHILPPAACSPVPGQLDSRDAAWFALAKIAFRGAQAADYRLGDRVMVIGAGPIGQMSVRWARAAGAWPITVVDGVEERLELARRGGATTVIGKPIGQLLDEGGLSDEAERPTVVIDTTGNPAVFTDALRVAAKFGRVVILGDTGMPHEQHLTSDFIRKGLTLVGAHDMQVRNGWKERQIDDLFFAFATSGRFDVGGLISHTFQPEEYAQAYDLADARRGQTMGILFDWRGEPSGPA